MSEERINSPVTAEASRIYAEHPPMTREEAAEHLKARGVLPPGADGKPVYTAPAQLPDHLAALLDQPKADPTATEKTLTAAGHDYKAIAAKVDGLLSGKAKAADLSASVLLSLAAYVDHHAQMAERFKRTA